MSTPATIAVPSLPLYRRGKVRDTFDLGDRLLMVATDRISAFDVVLPTLIPSKGVVLTQLSRFWFELTAGLVPNHVTGESIADLSLPEATGRSLVGRALIVRKAERIDVECVIRDYLAGSAWAEYQALGTVAGQALPSNLRLAEALPVPLFTPAIKSDEGHDVNISVEDLGSLVGTDLVARLEEASRDIFSIASDLALTRGIIVADTKFEFGWIDGELTLIDELLTPDSSRFWDAQLYEPGREQASFDKQPVRDWLTAAGWDRMPPGPELPPVVVEETRARYLEAYERLTGAPLADLADTSPP